MKRECNGKGVVPGSEEICQGCPKCDYVAATADKMTPIGMGVSKLPEIKIPEPNMHRRPIELKRVKKIEDVVRAIREATEYDGKTREQKALKLGEEVGELCREVLKHEEADGTHYRGKPTKEQLVEEITDVLICLFALAEMYEVTDQEIAQWARLKIKKWMSVTGEKR